MITCRYGYRKRQSKWCRAVNHRPRQQQRLHMLQSMHLPHTNVCAKLDQLQRKAISSLAYASFTSYTKYGAAVVSKVLCPDLGYTIDCGIDCAPLLCYAVAIDNQLKVILSSPCSRKCIVLSWQYPMQTDQACHDFARHLLQTCCLR